MIKKWIGDFIASVFNFIHKYILEMIVMSFIGLGICWTIGYFCNAIYGMHFELQSVWGGFSAIGGAGVLASVKYIMDSWKNSPEGEEPKDNSANATSKTTSMGQQIAKKASELMDDYAYDGKFDGKTTANMSENKTSDEAKTVNDNMSKAIERKIR